MESLLRLQGLHADLTAFNENRLANLDRLLDELRETVKDFRILLEKPQPSDRDRQAFGAGKVAVQVGDDAQEYSVNEEFKHISVEIGTAIELNEIEVAKILVQYYTDSVAPNLAFVGKVVADYQDRHDLLLQCLRMVFQLSEDYDLDEPVRMGVFREIILDVLESRHRSEAASAYIDKCLRGLQSIEQRYSSISTQLQNKQNVGQLAVPEYEAILDFQKGSLFKQHEALTCTLAWLFRGSWSGIQDFHGLARVVGDAKTPRWNKIDILLVHYIPAFGAAFNKYGNAEAASLDSSKLLNSSFGTIPSTDQTATILDPFAAALRLLWTVEYSSHFGPGKDDDVESKKCPEQLRHALKEHGLQLLLAIAASLTVNAWRHAARNEMVTHLLLTLPEVVLEGEQTSDYFQVMLMETLEAFAEAWISNMPDTIRQLKTEEDDLRLEQITAIQEGNRPDNKMDRPLPMHLEVFLILMSFAFENRPDASEQWWDDTESNLYGFLQWASKRQTVPRVSAFCEMLCSIAEGPEGAASAHNFLLDDSVPASISRTRRVPSMNYSQMFAELDLYAHKVHERAPATGIANRKILPTDMNESETPMMLSSYLRLIAHLCRNSSITRTFVFSVPSLDFPRTLLLLSSGPVPSYLRASIFSTLDAMLTEKDTARGTVLWERLDEWASNGHELTKAAVTKTEPVSTPTVMSLQNSLASIASTIDQYTAFVSFLRSLLDPYTHSGDLPFPENLGSTYRPPGIIPYIDFLCGQILSKRLPEASDPSQALLCTFHCLDAVARSLASFDETQAAMLTRGLAKNASTGIVTYMQRHPFARLMQWVLSPEMDKALMRMFKTTQQQIASAFTGSPLVQSVQRTIDVINMVLSLQATYFDVVKPLLKDAAYSKSLVGQIPMEQHIIAHPDIILELCQYTASEHLELSLRSLSLLQKLSSSAKLNNHFLATNLGQDRSRRIVDLLGPNASAILTSVSESLSVRLQVDERELDSGFEAPGYQYKDGLIAFLNACLATQPELTNIAHVLLGFRRLGERLAIPDGGENSLYLFDGLLTLVRDYPHGDDTGFVSWLVHIKTACMQVLRELWSSKVSSEITLIQLRRHQFLGSIIATQEAISESTRWDGRVVYDPEFWYTSSGEALTELLEFRSALYYYAAKEVREASRESLHTVLKQHLLTMLGNDMAGSPLGHANLFDLADFLELDLGADIVVPETIYFSAFEPTMFLGAETEDKPGLFDAILAREVLERERINLLQQQSQRANVSSREVAEREHNGLLQRQGNLSSASPIDEEQVSYEVDLLVARIEAKNRQILGRQAWRDALRGYVDMVVALIDCCHMDSSAKMQFILQILQLILPKLDALVSQESVETLELARIADSLLLALSTIDKAELVQERSSTTTHLTEADRLKQERLDSIITEKLFQLFRASIDGILMTTGAAAQRSILYSICTQYLSRIATNDTTDTDTNRKARANSMDCVRSSNMRLINILADDAEDGADMSRLNALNLLALLVSLARNEKSSYVLDSLIKANCLEIIIEPIKHIATDFQDTEPSRKSSQPYLAFNCSNTNTHVVRHHLLALYSTRMLLLLQLSRTRSGAGALLDAGLLPTIRDSLLFRADPDLGFSLPATASGTHLTTTKAFATPSSKRQQQQTAASLAAQTTASDAASAAALQNYYSLLAPTLRVLLSLFTSRGAHNEQAVVLVRQFLGDYRQNMVGVFKKMRGVSGRVNRETERVLGECVRCYTGLCVLSGWVEWEDEGAGHGMDGLEGGRAAAGNGVGFGAGNGMASVRGRNGHAFT
jgi:nuclear pore complex protein Nup205